MKFIVNRRPAALLAGCALHSAATAADVAPLTFINLLPFITVKIGATASPLLIDSGGSLAFRLLATDSACQTAPAGSHTCDPGELGTVQDGNGESLGKLTAQRIDLNGAPFDGILGAPFFQSRKVLFDLAGNRLLMSRFRQP